MTEVTAIQKIDDLGEVKEVLTSEMLGLNSQYNAHFTVIISEKDALERAHALVDEQVKEKQKDQIQRFLSATRHHLEQNGNTKQLTSSLQRHFVAKDIILNAVDRYGRATSAKVKKNESEKVVEKMMLDAEERGASDIHVTVGKDSKIAFRINGELELYGQERNQNELHSIIAVLYSNMAAKDGDIENDEFKPNEQADAVLYRELEDMRLGLRITTHPTTLTGKDYHMVMRVLGNQNEYAQRIPFDKLGFMYDQPNRIQQALRGKGMVLTIGETNSGKSVSQQNYLMLLNEEKKGTASIYSIENPIERQITGVTQFNLTEIKGVGASSNDSEAMTALLRYIMRADPDVLALAEIRDRMTALAAQKLSQTGHKVFGTLHCESPFDVFERLIGLGCDESTLMSGEVLGAVVSQKLVKRICPDCAHSIYTAHQLTEKQMVAIEQLCDMGLGHKVKQLRFRNTQPSGCKNPKCRNGLIGRQLIAECVNITPEILVKLAEQNKNGAKRLWLAENNFTKMDCALTAMFHGYIDCADVINEIGDLDSSYKLRNELDLPHPKVIYV